MLRHIFINLWNTRRRNIWIMLELVVIAIVCWMVIDPIFVILYNKSISNGFETDGLYRLQLSKVPNGNAGTSEEFYQLMQRLREHKQIESATYIVGGQYPCAPGRSYGKLRKDTVSVDVAFMTFIPKSDFFKTWRMRSAKDGTWETLEKLEYPHKSIILTSDAAQHLSPNQDLWGGVVYNRDSLPMQVAALAQPVKMRSSKLPYYLRLTAWTDTLPSQLLNDDVTIFARTKPGVAEVRFIEDFIPWMEEHLVAGSFFVSKIEPFHKVSGLSDLREGATNEIRIKYALCYFFLVNLFLGISGTFWLNTRTRREEIGVRLSYGSSPWKIRLMLLGEATVMVTVAVLIGCFLYFQWALQEGFYVLGGVIPSDDSQYITNQFMDHFLVISAIVYAIMLVVTWIGVWIPAYTISKISPVMALRDE